LDEAFLDVTDYCAAHGCDGAAAAAQLRAAVTAATRLTCSAGVAPNRLLAKMASDVNKPDGQCVIAPNVADVASFLHAMPVRKVPGIGRVAERLLAAAGVVTCGEVLAAAPRLSLLLSASAFELAHAAALGCGPTARPPPPAPGEAGRKGMSVERTFGNCGDAAALERKLAELAASLAAHLAREGLTARCVTLKLKTAAFELRTRQAALPRFTNAEAELFECALRLLRAEPRPLCCRLMGLRASAFLEPPPAPPPGQRTLRFAPSGAPPPPGEYVCADCGASVLESARAEHADYHVARALQRQLRDADAKAEGRGGAGGGAKRKGGGAIQTLFKRAAAQQ
jgi:DNA polymerase kappa